MPPNEDNIVDAKQAVLNLTRPSLETIKLGDWIEIIASKVVAVEARSRHKNGKQIGWVTEIHLDNKIIAHVYRMDCEEQQNSEYRKFVADWKAALARI